MLVNASEYIFFHNKLFQLFFHCKKKKKKGQKKRKKDTPLEYCCNICDSQSVEAVLQIDFLFCFCHMKSVLLQPWCSLAIVFHIGSFVFEGNMCIHYSAIISVLKTLGWLLGI